MLCNDRIAQSESYFTVYFKIYLRWLRGLGLCDHCRITIVKQSKNGWGTNTWLWSVTSHSCLCSPTDREPLYTHSLILLIKPFTNHSVNLASSVLSWVGVGEKGEGVNLLQVRLSISSGHPHLFILVSCSHAHLFILVSCSHPHRFILV